VPTHPVALSLVEATTAALLALALRDSGRALGSWSPRRCSPR